MTSYDARAQGGNSFDRKRITLPLHGRSRVYDAGGAAERWGRSVAKVVAVVGHPIVGPYVWHPIVGPYANHQRCFTCGAAEHHLCAGHKDYRPGCDWGKPKGDVFKVVITSNYNAESFAERVAEENMNWHEAKAACDRLQGAPDRPDSYWYQVREQSAKLWRGMAEFVDEA